LKNILAAKVLMHDYRHRNNNSELGDFS